MPHLLRRSAGTHLLQAGVDISLVQEFLGHATIKSTQQYLQLDTSYIRAVHRRYHPRGRVEGENDNALQPQL